MREQTVKVICGCGRRRVLGAGLGRLEEVRQLVADGWCEDGRGELWKCPDCAVLPVVTERTHDVSQIGVGDKAVRFCDSCRAEHEFTCVAVAAGAKVGRAWCEKLQADYCQFLAVDYPPRDARG